jgi:hypothetical protein
LGKALLTLIVHHRSHEPPSGPCHLRWHGSVSYTYKLLPSCIVQQATSNSCSRCSRERGIITGQWIYRCSKQILARLGAGGEEPRWPSPLPRPSTGIAPWRLQPACQSIGARGSEEALPLSRAMYVVYIALGPFKKNSQLCHV